MTQRRSVPPAAVLLAIVAALIPAGSWAAPVPAYSVFELEVRNNFTGAFNLPDGAFFSSSTIDVGDGREVAIKIGVLTGLDARSVWFGAGGAGSIVYTTPIGAFISDVSINRAGRVVFEQVFSTPSGLYVYDPVAMSTTLVTNLPLGASGWGSPSINFYGAIGFRADFNGGHAYASWAGGTPAIHATEVTIDLGSLYSFLFTPAFNDRRQIAAKVRLGAAGQTGNERPDQIRIFAADGSSVLVVEDHDSNPTSPYAGFDNSVALTNRGRVAFIATLVAGGRGVYLWDGGTVIEIAREAVGDVGQVEFFGPAANDYPLVVFRGRNAAGLQTIFAGDGSALQPVIHEHDLIPTDLGTARIDQHDASPVFGGGVAINVFNDVGFTATLTPPDDNQVEWGTGAFVAKGNGIFFDGFEDGTLAAWSLAVP
ncbi:MAG: hypothetical protein HC897_07445 [Thermoanaerobaculia bacterium]|nr:hypothetical protein [Thermoanaerobaculia bacterium]